MRARWLAANAGGEERHAPDLFEVVQDQEGCRDLVWPAVKARLAVRLYPAAGAAGTEG